MKNIVCLDVVNGIEGGGGRKPIENKGEKWEETELDAKKNEKH